MPGQRIRPVSQHAPVGEVREADAEGHGRPGVDAGEHDHDRAPDRHHKRIILQPVCPVRSALRIIERAAVTHQDEGRVADQGGDPAGGEWIGAADMGVQRLQGQHIADRGEGDVDHEHDRDQPVRRRHRALRDPLRRGGDRLPPIARHDRDHEGEEEALHRPGPVEIVELVPVGPVGPADQQLAEMPGAILRLLQPPVQPEDIGHGKEQHRHDAVAEHIHGEEILAVPIPAADAVKRADDRPDAPEAGDLGDADIGDLAELARRAVPVDAGRGIAVHLVDEQGPEHHRQTAGDEGAEPRQRPGHAIDPRDHRPGEQAGQADHTGHRAHRRFGAGIVGPGLGIDLERGWQRGVHGKRRLNTKRKHQVNTGSGTAVRPTRLAFGENPFTKRAGETRCRVSTS